MKIKLLAFGIASDIIGENEMSMELPDSSTVSSLKSSLKSSFSHFEHIRDFAIAVNETYADEKLEILDGDVVAIIPPVSGG